jgi:hypothetical protein
VYGNPIPREEQNLANRFVIFTSAILRSAFWLLLAGVFQNVYADTKEFESCNWLVSYRNRTYDLSPLTKEGLARPVDGDLRTILTRVPEADEKLQAVTDHAKEAKFHSIVGTASMMALIGTRIARSQAKNKGRSEDTLVTLDVVSMISGLFFIKATYDSGVATKATKDDLIEAVKAFNAHSPYKVEPARKGST